jgi:hypothetical protein
MSGWGDVRSPSWTCILNTRHLDGSYQRIGRLLKCLMQHKVIANANKSMLMDCCGGGVTLE